MRKLPSHLEITDVPKLKAASKVASTGKKRVWRVTPNAPHGEYVDVDTVPPRSDGRAEWHPPSYALSTFELTYGLDISEDNATVPAELMDELFKKPAK